MLQLANVGVLRRKLDLALGAVADLLDRVARLVQRLILGTAPQFNDGRERARYLGRRIGTRDVNRHALRLSVADAGRLPPVVVLQRHDDVGLLGLADDRDRNSEAARGVLHSRPGKAERIDLQDLASAVRREARRAPSFDRLGGCLARGLRTDLQVAGRVALGQFGKEHGAMGPRTIRRGARRPG